MKKLTVFMVLVMVLMALPAAALDAPASYDYKWGKWEQIEFAGSNVDAIEAVTNTTGHDFGDMHEAAFCQLTRTGSTNIVWTLQGSKTWPALGWANVTSQQTFAVANSDTYQYGLDETAGHVFRALRFHVVSGVDGSNAITNAICGVLQR